MYAYLDQYPSTSTADGYIGRWNTKFSCKHIISILKTIWIMVLTNKLQWLLCIIRICIFLQIDTDTTSDTVAKQIGQSFDNKVHRIYTLVFMYVRNYYKPALSSTLASLLQYSSFLWAYKLHRYHNTSVYCITIIKLFSTLSGAYISMQNNLAIVYCFTFWQ